MKFLISGLILVLLTSCGAGQSLCGSDINMACNFLFGEKPVDYDDRLDDIDNKIKEIEADLGQLFERDTFLETEIQYTQDVVQSNRSAIQNNEVLIDVIEAVLIDLEDELDAQGFRITELESDRKIKEVIRPCPNAKEVLLKLDDGVLLGYFENGGNRYLSQISNGSYITSDGTNCHFRVTGSGTDNLAITQN